MISPARISDSVSPDTLGFFSISYLVINLTNRSHFAVVCSVTDKQYDVITW